MTSEPSQTQRVAKLKTPLGADVLVLTHFEGTEGLSELFEFQIQALSDRQNIDFNAALGQNCSVTFATHGRERVFNGVLVEALWEGQREIRYGYRLKLRPWLWLLSHKAGCKIFADKNAPDIIKDVFDKAGFKDFRDGLTETYPVIEYCVQYRETDLAFVCRLMEYYGIYYYFEHSSDKHTLVLADAKSSHKPLPGGGKLPYIQLAGQDRRDREHIFLWTSERRFRSGKVTIKDYDYLQPNADLLSESQRPGGYSHDSLEVYDFPGKYPRKNSDTQKNRSDGEHFAKLRLEAEQARDRRRYADGDAASVFPGCLAQIQQHPTDDGEYLAVRAAHEFSTEEYRTGTRRTGDQIYAGKYEWLRSDTPFRTPLVTPKPLVHGPQTAKVVGKKGEEIDVDKHGRILVEFHWDRDKKPSRRVRVAQVWSGKNWGGQVIPRIGQEVVVDFLEGDPDRPLVVGTVYNNEYKYPYELPAKKTQSGLKSDSSKGGGGFNELRFEDDKGKEQVYFRAEKDHEVLIRNTENSEIGVAFDTPVGKYSRKTTLKNGDDELYVDKGNQKVKIGNDQTVNVGNVCSITATAKIVLTVGASSITLEPTGIKISAPSIQVEGVKDIKLTAMMIEIN